MASNLFAYAFPAVALAGVTVYLLYSALNRFGLARHETQARVTGKQFAPGSTTYNTNIVAGQALTQSSRNPDAYIITLELNGVATGGAVTPQMYELLQPGELVHVTFKRTRFSNQILVTDIRR